MDRVKLDAWAGFLMKALAASSLLILLLVVVGLLSKSDMILSSESLPKLIFSSEWKPSKGLFGFWPYITGTILVTFFTMVFSVPLCLMSAIYLAEYSTKTFKSAVKAGIDTLAGIPSVLFGLWGVLFIVPFVRDFVAPAFGYETSGYCILSGSLVLSVMVVPIMLSLMQEVIMSTPQDLKESSYAVGATRWETIKKIILPKMSPGLFSAVILGFSRVFGETMAVLMVVGNVATHATSPFDPVYPLTALIANNYGEMMSVPLYESALLFGALLLLIIVVAFNLLARMVMRKLQTEAC
jgi:phosphate transport system permease protein